MINLKAKEQIYQYIKTRQKARVNDLWREVGFSRQLVQRKLKELIEENVVQKSGKPPLVFYQLMPKAQTENEIAVPQELIDLVNEKYLYVSPLGELAYGYSGFTKWVNSIGEYQNTEKLLIEYKQSITEIDKLSNKFGFIDATEKIKQTFPHNYLNKLYYP